MHGMRFIAGCARPAVPALLALAIGIAVGTVPASAQLVLPGSGAPAPSAPGTGGLLPPTASPLPGATAPPPRPVAPKLPAEASVLGKVLLFNGTKGKLIVDRRDKANLAVTLIAVGEKLSRPGEACGLDLGNGRPLELAAAGRPDGVPRYTISIPACTMELDLLDGSVLVTGPAASCPFPEGDCRIDARGLWGPSPSALESQSKTIESDRARADKAVRENFKALIARTKDRKDVKSVAAEQAGFTSERETVCRDYVRESVHGYCSARFTELRAAELASRVAALGGPPVPKPSASKPRPVPAASPGVVEQVPASAAPAPAPPRPAPPPKSIFDIFR